jgi:hypothetical protein
MDLWQMVRADHANIRELCREVLRATGSGPNSRASLFAELDVELERHIRAKERVLYPVRRRMTAPAANLPNCGVSSRRYADGWISMAPCRTSAAVAGPTNSRIS